MLFLCLLSSAELSVFSGLPGLPLSTSVNNQAVVTQYILNCCNVSVSAHSRCPDNLLLGIFCSVLNSIEESRASLSLSLLPPVSLSFTLSFPSKGSTIIAVVLLIMPLTCFLIPPIWSQSTLPQEQSRAGGEGASFQINTLTSLPVCYPS